MPNNHPLVSIIMPSFNAAQTISESIESVLAQTYTNWELVIVDDQSTDSTWSLINRYAQSHANIHVYQNSDNCGAGVSRNCAIERAQGRFIAFLDADDVWEPNKLTVQVGVMLKNGYPFTYTHYTKFKGNQLLSTIKAPSQVTYSQLLYSNVIGCLTAMYDTSVLGKRYMPLIRKRQDMGLWLDILKDIPAAHCIPESLAKYRIDTGMTANKLTVLSYQWRFYRDVVKLPILQAISVFCVYAIKGFLKHKV
ncbi:MULTISPECIES: glycosyltransferase family 2 protein [unclassified Salinivibrio]|uniref:glycosyltransferase family 2 protein n=1 Tax=unclassified Salinivibrio TaxID=2636825 RepID=UPI00128DADCC|nr:MULTISPECIES: glycosyltransferase family 2 protein [unclassified Salinivibrio]MPS32392.1 glycosyltransferase family 2 protein [Salinivibrio sp. VYel7]MPX90685.1 glycosyltransferase family 2 protein [Salinivibrio sp. VYel1]MPX93785.1 glycosyltransferase family 2 protein [Salinivibrio sp. VYel9]MPX96022.1 glycosyltransferase family 2 protein [Salinivibrio sp. VYel6]MPY00250.1 glycosyltransferase family 2 protein [Salinivibrio sp. VYel4]